MKTNNLYTSLLKMFDENGIVLDPNNDHEDLSLDSLQFVSLIVSIESEYDISIPDDSLSIAKFSCFADFYNLISQLTLEKV
ncbi:phosphopantetheine-binding protein [Paenibacillus sp.]|uniref:phosphopantetheine-binding protein n=1 Tax=Paenibacillus sp. TaxID=58172 RepID=UPI0028AB498C|nr:phosphopantetheine-binding protein [Paenibacillus sp.]